MPYIKIWIHTVWAVKSRMPLLTRDCRHIIIKHIRENAFAKNIFADHINGFNDHLHCLISLNSDQSIAKVMQLIKGESSYWINKNNIIRQKFQWCEEYFALSISERDIPKVRAYIRNQEQHHLNHSWEEEYNEYIEKYGFVKIPDEN